MLINKVEKKENGFSLVELLAVVGIGGALIAGALLLVNDVNAKKEIKQGSENISAIYANMENLFSDETVDGVTMQELVNAGVFPSTLKISGDSVTNSNGGDILITPDGDGYTLSYPKVKQSACVEILKNQRRVGWDQWGTSINAGKENRATAGVTMSTTSVRDFADAGACGTKDNDWVSITLGVDD